MKSNTKVVEGISTHYLSGGAGQSIVLIHGLGGGSGHWKPNIRALRKHFEVIALDLPGFGDSDLPRDFRRWDLTHLSEHLAAFMDALSLDRPWLVGNSLGGAVALYTAHRFSSSVAGLILLAPAAVGNAISWGLRLMSVPVVGEVMAYLSRNADPRRALRQMVYRKEAISSELIDYTAYLMGKPHYNDAMLQSLRGHNLFCSGQGRISLNERLNDVGHPTLVIWGRQDPVLPCSNSRWVQKMPHARLVTFDRCGHLPQIEYPECFHRLTKTFIRSQEQNQSSR